MSASAITCLIYQAGMPEDGSVQFGVMLVWPGVVASSWCAIYFLPDRRAWLVQVRNVFMVWMVCGLCDHVY